MPEQSTFSRAAKAYIATVILTGIGATGYSSYDLYVHPVSNRWLVLAALTLLTGTFTVKVPSVAARISVSEAFVFASVLLFGPSVGTVIVALDCAVMAIWMHSDSRSPIRTLFNVSAVALAIWVASNAFFMLIGGAAGSLASLTLSQLAWPLFVFAGVYFLLNSWLIAFALAAERDQNAWLLWTQNFPWLSLNYFGGASVAALLVAYTRSVDIGALGIIIPLLVISYLTYRTSLGRVEDAKRHVEQVNVLYMSTIEALAMAVDAKDQITHGHIRRVQVYAVDLARHLGVEDENQIKAIEAAALLHDMGKLAIPEHILNKPGKLTAGEFDKMKRHADIGADLLSEIPFPYPVVPIVRHHHENWDGTGYPNKVAGTDIPLGARILSVVDCFDALTSDRPYRPRLSVDEAFGILRERSGSMYDPLVVDAFIAAFYEIAPAAIRAGQHAKSLVPVGFSAESDDHSRALEQIQAGSAEATSLLESHRSCLRAATAAEALQAMSSTIREFTPAHVVALYEYIPHADALRCTGATNDADAILSGFEIAKGERTTGWVAANERTIINSAAVLDFGPLAHRFTPPLRSTLSVPIRVGANTVGVLSFYSQHEAPFTDRHTYVAEQLASFLSERMLGSQRMPQGVVRFPEPGARITQVRK
jgi:putative nucleotidyltransferase with HDIG domain